jgi:transposase InsO family protein
MADHPGHELALAALDMAIAYERSAPGLMHHSDRGVQLAAHDYRKRSLQDGLIYSMSRKGDCWDDALDGELVALCDYFMRDEARTDVFQSVEGFHNRRRHSGIGYPTPEQMAVACQAAALAA